MLWHKEIGAGGISKGLSLIFQTSLSHAEDNSFTISISGASLQEGDLILTSVVTRRTSDVNYSVAGFTELADIYVNNTDDCNFGLFYKVADGTETGIDVTTNVPQTTLSTTYIWRNADTTIPLDVGVATNTATGATLVTSPDVTTVTDNAVVMQFIAAAGQGTLRPLTNFTQPSNTDNFFTIGGGTTKIAACSSVQETAGATSLNDFGGGTANSGNSSATATIAIRPLVDGRAVEYSGTFESISSAGTLDIPAIADNQMVVLMERANSATPPSTRAGFTSAVTSAVASISRSMRLSYRVGGSAESISTSNNAGFAIFNYATTIGQTAAYGTNGYSTSPPYKIPISAISSLDTSGNSALFAMPYVQHQTTGVDSPYTVVADLGAYIEENTSASIAQTDFTVGIDGWHISCVMEIKN